MNYLINSVWNKLKGNPIVGGGIIILLAILIWYKGSQVWNAIGNQVFAVKMSWQGRKVQAELESAAEQKAEIDRTLTEFAVAKKELESVKAEKDRLEKVFNDQSKTAAEKVAEFKKAVADDPMRTATDNITTEDLCARARAIGASAATVSSLCGQ